MDLGPSLMKVIEVMDGAAAAGDQPRSGGRDPAFVIPESAKLPLRRLTGDSDLGAFLAHQVARTPNDLQPHVQRIYLHVTQTNAVEGYGALVDLFIVLGPRGGPLRRRVLKTARPLLEPRQYEALVHKLEGGLHAADAIPSAPASMLSKGIRGAHQLVERVTTRAAGMQDPLDEARSCLEYGQVEQARELLEDALLSEPWRLDLHGDLLEIYRAMRDGERLAAMWTLLDAAQNPAAEAWAETAQRLGVPEMARQ
jgi:hypothetical protein